MDHRHCQATSGMVPYHHLGMIVSDMRPYLRTLPVNLCACALEILHGVVAELLSVNPLAMTEDLEALPYTLHGRRCECAACGDGNASMWPEG